MLQTQEFAKRKVNKESSEALLSLSHTASATKFNVTADEPEESIVAKS